MQKILQMWFLLIMSIFPERGYPFSSDILQVLTFNTGLLKLDLGFTAIDLVACVDQRLELQVKHIFRKFEMTESSKSSLRKKFDFFILNLQEVWDRKSFEAYKKNAQSRGFAIIPEDFDRGEVSSYGLITITNLKVLSSNLIRFSKNYTPKKKSFLETKMEFKGNVFSNVNVHTDYSDKFSPFPSHLNQLSELAQHMNESDVLQFVSGDFNAGKNTGFKGEIYNSSKTIWQDGFMNKVKKASFLESLSSKLYTWDVKNPLVRSIPTFIKFIEWVDEWDDKNGALDNILYRRSPQFQHLKTETTLKEKYQTPKSCGLEADFIHLSDHYGIKSSFLVEGNFEYIASRQM